MSTTTTTPTVATSGKLDTTKTPDMLKSSRSKTPEKEKKAVSIDNKLENRLTMKDLAKLQKAFMTEGDGYDNKLALYRDMFCEALSILLDKGTREEYGELFDKVDVAKEGTVDWDKFASHMLLEFYERDDRVKSTQVPQWKDLKMLQTPHKDIVQRVQYLKSSNRYVSISKEGTVGIWGPDLKLSRSFRIATDSCKARDLWVTHFVALQNINKIAVAFTSKEIAIYDMGNKLEFNCQYKVQGMEFTPLCLDYWYNPKDANEAILCWGDVGGYVNCLFFNSANIALFERPPAPAGEKQVWEEPCLNVNLQDVGNETLFKNETYTRHEAHRKEWVRQVKYAHYLECFISCSTTSTNSMVIGWMEKKTGATTKDQGTSKKIQRVSNFNISQGVNTFDYNQHLNIIATAGVNHHVCLWNPHIVSKPNGVLRGHMASVIQVQFIKSRGQLISFSKDKVLRIWDVQLQVCIQRLAGMFPKGPEVVSTLFFDEERDRSGMERNKMLITFNYQITLMEMKTENRDKIMSHDKPVTAAIYNSVFNQVISVCQAGTLIVWMIDTGQKVKQFNNTHANAEVTCLAQDPTETKLFTGSTDGTVKVWDFNGHCFHTLECAGGQPADIGQILNLKRSVVVVGWTKQITVFPTASFKDFHVQPAEWKGGKLITEHSEDILCCAFTGPNHLATGSYDGEIVIWNTNSEHISRRLNQRSRRLLVKSRQKSFMQARKESANSQRSVSKASQKSGKSQTSGAEDTNEFGLAIAKLIFLDTRKGNSAGGGANLISGGGNGWVRFWNTSHTKLIGEFVAHQQSGSILMATDKKNHYMATGDVDGVIKVWDISEYCVQAADDIITTAPPMKCQFQAHSDMINTLEMCERNERVLVISASSDCSVAMYDVLGNMIGIFGQEEHWKIEHYDPAEEMVEESESEEEIEESKDYEVEEVVEEDDWEPDERAITDPEGFRINTWDNTLLGKNYQELRVQKRERKQPSTIPDLPYLHWERTGHAPAGPYSSLDTQVIQDFDPPKKPNMSYTETVSQASNLPKLPNLVDTLKQPVPEKEIFPKYILDFEAKMKDYHRRQLSQGNSNNAPGLLGLKGKLGAGMAKSSLQSIGLQLGKQVLNVPSKPTKSVKSMKVRSVSRRTSIVSTEASQAY